MAYRFNHLDYSSRPAWNLPAQSWSKPLKFSLSNRFRLGARLEAKLKKNMNIFEVLDGVP